MIRLKKALSFGSAILEREDETEIFPREIKWHFTDSWGKERYHRAELNRIEGKFAAYITNPKMHPFPYGVPISKYADSQEEMDREVTW